MYVIGVDPGPIPGVVRLQVASTPANPTPVIERADVVQCSSGVLVPVLNALIDFEPAAALAYEPFVIGPRSARSSTPAAGRATSGMARDLAYWANHHSIPSRARRAAEVKPWATDDRLAAAGLLDLTKGMRHARDAARHALFCAVKDFGLPDPLSRKAVRHNHITRDIKPLGVCPACDQYHANQSGRDA